MRSIVRIAVLAAAVAAGMAVPALAQDTPKWEVSGGYAFMRDRVVDLNLQGWTASAAGNLTPMLGMVGEVEGVYNGEPDFTSRAYTFAAGPRFSMRSMGNVTPFFHVFVGAQRFSQRFGTEDFSTTDFLIQPGAGIDIGLAPSIEVRVGGDYRRVLTEGEGTNQFRFHVGIVIVGAAK